MKKSVLIFSKDVQWILRSIATTTPKTCLPLFSAGFPVVSLSILLVLILSSCHTSKTVPIETIKTTTKTDTLYINNVQYDSIYVNNEHYVDRSKDTVYIRDSSIEFRYELLRDTIYKSKTDSIPVIRTVEVENQVKYVPWYAKALAWFRAIAVLLVIITIVIKLTKR